MPRVTEEHRAARRQQILDAAQRCFARDGFHASSMSDVLREANLSAGAVYRYYASKDAIFAELSDRMLDQLFGAIRPVLQAEPVIPVGDAFRQALRLLNEHAGPEGMVRVIVGVWGEALRDEAIGAVVRHKLLQVRDECVDYAGRLQQAGLLTHDADHRDLGTALLSLFPGYILQALLIGDVDADGYAAAVGALVTRR